MDEHSNINNYRYLPKSTLNKQLCQPTQTTYSKPSTLKAAKRLKHILFYFIKKKGIQNTNSTPLSQNIQPGQRQKQQMKEPSGKDSSFRCDSKSLSLEPVPGSSRDNLARTHMELPRTIH